ncbi:hypothetical protein [Litorihabitans aurantiacus]|uniref:Uncharacterized protein n=1 Tax=Litorihabitans aurantiacus TaxID=1930061 RepID=A0AA37USD5_9MICO|nr:hypothetical protein [Litorihabitans aurantiacus]GMA31253.1 hypothetical protein GCM10025875_12450 [Litorihabitans aurantiacus]
MLTADAGDASALTRQLVAPAGDGSEEQVAGGEGAVYWWCPRGASLTTPVAEELARRSRGHVVTTRNLRTMVRLTA